MLNYKELKTQAANLTQRSYAEIADELGNWMNLSLESLYNEYDYIDELKGRKDFTTVDGTATYYMPSDFEKAFRMYDITNNKRITPRVEQDYFDGNIANIADATEADAEVYYFTEVVGVNVQVATTGDTVQAKSSSTSDTSVNVRVEGYLDSSLTIIGSELITVTGTTAVAGTTTFYKITHFSIDENSVGYITLEDSSGVDLGIISSGQRVSRYKAFQLRLIPDDSTTEIRTLYKKKYRRLINDQDYPFLDADGYLIYGAASIGMIRDKENIDRAAFIDKERDKALARILLNQATKLGDNFQHTFKSGIIDAHRS